MCWKMFLRRYCFLLPSVCVATVFAVGLLVGLVSWIVCWRIFLILYCFLLLSVCGDLVCVCAVDVLVGLVAPIMCWN